MKKILIGFKLAIENAAILPENYYKNNYKTRDEAIEKHKEVSEKVNQYLIDEALCRGLNLLYYLIQIYLI